jgi:hypothetical protein
MHVVDRHSRRCRGGLAVAMLLATVASGASAAQARPTRSGFMFGLSLGGAAATACDGCEGVAGPMVELHAGAWLSPRWAVSGEIWVTVDQDAVSSFTALGQTTALVAVTHHLGARVWVKGGAGLTEYSTEDLLAEGLTGEDNEVSYEGLGLCAAAGYELVQAGSFFLDAGARLSLGVFPDHGSSALIGLGIGIGWN